MADLSNLTLRSGDTLTICATSDGVTVQTSVSAITPEQSAAERQARRIAMRDELAEALLRYPTSRETAVQLADRLMNEGWAKA